MKEINWRSCHSMGEEHEAVKLEEWVKEHHEKKGRDLRILEIGAFQGQTTSLLVQAGYVWTIDLFGNVDVGPRNYDQIGTHHFISFIKNMTRLELIDRVFPLVCTSSILGHLPFMAFDFIYIDGGHAYEDVQKDIEKSSKHLSEDGLICGDDYMRWGWSYPYPDGRPPEHAEDVWGGVARAFNEFLAQGEFEIKEHYAGKVCLRRKQ